MLIGDLGGIRIIAMKMPARGSCVNGVGPLQMRTEMVGYLLL